MFNESHQRHLLTSLHHIDEVLSEAAAKLEPFGDGRLFKPYAADASASQRKVLGDYLTQLRFAVRRFMEAHGLRERSKPVSGLWAFQTALSFAQITVEELRPNYLRGYGALDAEATRAAEQFVAELTTLLRRIMDYIERGEGGDLAARLAQLDATDDAVRLLGELERVIGAQGLIELRATLQNLVERAASPRFEIAVFGRVNSGKSSLLNWWLEQPLLPTGVTPVTAVPTHIVHGERAVAHVRTAYFQPVTIPMDELSAYVTEEGNPRNTKRVLDVLIEVPAARLKDGICLVDTPGLGSLATAGAAQTLEYLPRCDLGIMLIESGGVVRREDLDVARAVLDSGVDLMIALSKADQVSSTELPRALAYVAEQFRADLGVSLPIAPVSTVESHVALARTWFERELAPRLASHREQSAASLKRKVGALREAVIAMLEARLSSRPGTSPHTSPAPTAKMPNGTAQARADVQRARHELIDLGSHLHRYSTRVLDVTAEELSRCWLEDVSDSETSGRVLSAIARCVAEAGEAASRLLGELRKNLQQVLTQSGIGADTVESLPLPRGRPLFEVLSIAPQTYARPRWAPGIRPLFRAMTRERLEAALSATLSERLGVHGDALRAWGAKYVDELSSQFEGAIAIAEGTERVRTTSGPALQDAASIHRDVDMLRNWSRANERVSA